MRKIRARQRSVRMKKVKKSKSREFIILVLIFKRKTGIFTNMMNLIKLKISMSNILRIIYGF